ncbi:SDR family oxidoreductase [Geodermatophilus sp. DF01-2]|uniref:SDR family NAD(P)-dependent oxidoreductase n=1 Tax=Geodermatophilus sp. DF01-2 TaxID=2559610 RepID=UPI001073CE3F|nr:SDR family oxidoreductase [Geodermatophilus sp. DF01_2]TFV64741.1 SDR family oxidoreductase [Geodermatophilus sp. DF01_2]
MDLELQGRRVLVTGASGGLGAAIAAGFVAEGARVLAASRTDEYPVPDGVAGRVLADLGAPEAGETLAAAARETLGGLDTLVAAAGGAVKGRVDELPDEVWDAGLEVNLRSAIRLVRATAPLLRTSGGRVVLLSALSASEPRGGHAVSNVGKAGLAALGKTLSRELATDGVLVNCVAPGRIRSRQLDRNFPSEEARAEFAAAHIPLGRFAGPEEIVPVTLLLGSPANTYITGQTVGVDGGMAWGI